MSTRPTTFANIRHELLSRPPKTYLDHIELRKSTQLCLSIPGLNSSRLPRHIRLTTPDNRRILPQGHHLIYCAPNYPASALLPDGTDREHSPGPPFTRRLWAGGSVRFNDGWRVPCQGAPTPFQCREAITNVRLTGVSPTDQAMSNIVLGADDKVFVDIERQYKIRATQDPLIVERRTLCFMAPKTADEIKRDLEQPSNSRKRAKAPKPPPQHSQSFELTPAALFRFSALTFNAHRIHLDPQHCREVEGYRDLLVHGPLLLLLMFSVLADHGLTVSEITYRNLAPVFVGERIKVCLRESREGRWDVWIQGPHEGLRVKGTAIIEGQAEDLRLKKLLKTRQENELAILGHQLEDGPTSERISQDSIVFVNRMNLRSESLLSLRPKPHIAHEVGRQSLHASERKDVAPYSPLREERVSTPLLKTEETITEKLPNHSGIREIALDSTAKAMPPPGGMFAPGQFPVLGGQPSFAAITSRLTKKRHDEYARQITHLQAKVAGSVDRSRMPTSHELRAKGWTSKSNHPPAEAAVRQADSKPPAAAPPSQDKTSKPHDSWLMMSTQPKPVRTPASRWGPKLEQYRDTSVRQQQPRQQRQRQEEFVKKLERVTVKKRETVPPQTPQLQTVETRKRVIVEKLATEPPQASGEARKAGDVPATGLQRLGRYLRSWMLGK